LWGAISHRGCSDKSKALFANPKVSLSFFWPNLERQVIISSIKAVNGFDVLCYFIALKTVAARKGLQASTF
jgi:pyridoxine/pyridoxamine 5'-phosphate oxidase